MDPPDGGELSNEELELISDFLSNSHKESQNSVARLLTTQPREDTTFFGTGIADVIHIVSGGISDIDREVLRLSGMKRELLENISNSPVEEDIPADAEITPEFLNRLSIQAELTSYYSQIGILLEEFSKEAVMNRVVDEERLSNRVEDDVQGKTQWEREWLLFITGVLDSGEKSNIREAYKKRNQIVHDSKIDEVISEKVELEKTVTEAFDAVDLLHEKAYGINMNQRTGDLLIGER